MNQLLDKIKSIDNKNKKIQKIKLRQVTSDNNKIYIDPITLHDQENE